MHKLLLRGLTTALLVAWLLPAASAQIGEVREACAADAARLCPGVIGGGRVAACLVAQAPRLSGECANALAIVAALKSCELDQQRFCRGVLPGGGRVFVCLSGHAMDLSQPCNAALKANVPGYRGY
jgi:hypothetical protein